MSFISWRFGERDKSAGDVFVVCFHFRRELAPNDGQSQSHRCLSSNWWPATRAPMWVCLIVAECPFKLTAPSFPASLLDARGIDMNRDSQIAKQMLTKDTSKLQKMQAWVIQHISNPSESILWWWCSKSLERIWKNDLSIMKISIHWTKQDFTIAHAFFFHFFLIKERSWPMGTAADARFGCRLHGSGLACARGFISLVPALPFPLELLVVINVASTASS